MTTLTERYLAWQSGELDEADIRATADATPRTDEERERFADEIACRPEPERMREN